MIEWRSGLTRVPVMMTPVSFNRQCRLQEITWPSLSLGAHIARPF